MRELAFPIAKARVTEAGLEAFWEPSQLAEATYIGQQVPWSDVMELDSRSAPPEVRLRDGRTLFVAPEHREALAAAAGSLGISDVARPDVWAAILEPYLDTATNRRANRRDLSRLGVPRWVVRRARRRLRVPMMRLTLLTWEWERYGHADAVTAFATFGDPDRQAQANFRRWTDSVAARKYSR